MVEPTNFQQAVVGTTAAQIILRYLFTSGARQRIRRLNDVSRLRKTSTLWSAALPSSAVWTNS